LTEKKTPKNSKKAGKKKERLENFIILGIFIIFVAVVGYLFYVVNMPVNDETVAVVNGEAITRTEFE